MYRAKKAMVKNQIPNLGRNLELIEKEVMTAKVYKKNNGLFHIHFTALKYEKVFKDEKQAIEKCNELNFNFYSENKDKLPKGITLDTTEKRFRLNIRLNNDTVKHIKSSKDLNKLIEIRNHILKNLLELF